MTRSALDDRARGQPRPGHRRRRHSSARPSSTSWSTAGAGRDRRARQLRPRPPGEPRRRRWPAAGSTRRRGRHPRPRRWCATSTRGHRRRLPPGRDPHHPVRRGAAAGARGAGRRHVQRARGRRRRRGRARSSPRRRRRSTAWPRSSRPTERHHPYNNDTFYGAAKAFNEGMLRSFHAMYGLDYVALRYFNVYGPRMDIHGVYTEVLVRWMERIAAGEPPLILGDGQPDDGLRLRRRHRPGQRARRRGRRHRRRCSTSPAATETSLLELAEALLRGDGLRPARRARPGARGQRRRPPAGRHRARPRASSASRPRSTSTRACAELVEWWRRSATRSPLSADRPRRRHDRSR